MIPEPLFGIGRTVPAEIAGGIAGDFGVAIVQSAESELLEDGGMTVAGQMAEYGHLRPSVSGCGRLIYLQITLASRFSEWGKTFKQRQGVCVIC